MNIKSEHGQGLLVFVGIVALVALAVFAMSMAGTSRGMQSGADTIGKAVGSAIDDAQLQQQHQDWLNIDWQITNGTVVSFWVNQQRIYPSKHSIERHGADAWAATNCYNNNGAFMTARSGLDWHLLCREQDGAVRTTVWRQESANSNRFHMQSAYTPKGGVWKSIMQWMERQGFVKQSMPADAVFVIDNVIP